MCAAKKEERKRAKITSRPAKIYSKSIISQVSSSMPATLEQSPQKKNIESKILHTDFI